MRILDRYVLMELIGPFVFGVTSFASIFVGSSVMFRIAQYITKYNADTWSLVKLFLFSLPEIINFTFPMSMLLASLISFGRLSGNSEITAMKSGGISFFRLAAPVFAVAFCVSVFSMVFAEKVVPASKLAYSQVLHYEIEKNTKPKTQEHIVLKNVSGASIERLTYARRFDEQDGAMYDITLEEFEKDVLVRVQNAEKAVWKDDTWIMYNGMVFDLSIKEGISRTMRFEEQVLPISSRPMDIAREQKGPDQMTVEELRKHMELLKRQYLPTSRYEMEIHQRVTIPMASLVFAMIGTPLGLQPNRASSSVGLAFSVVIIFIYYIIMTITTALGQGGAITPLLAAWIPNIVGIISGIYLMRKMSR